MKGEALQAKKRGVTRGTRELILHFRISRMRDSPSLAALLLVERREVEKGRITVRRGMTRRKSERWWSEAHDAVELVPATPESAPNSTTRGRGEEGDGQGRERLEVLPAEDVLLDRVLEVADLVRGMLARRDREDHVELCPSPFRVNAAP